MMNYNEVIGVDLGGTKVQTARVKNGEVAGTYKQLISSQGSEDQVIQEIISAIQAVMTSSVQAIGIGVPSVVDIEKGIVYDVQNIPAWQEVHLKDILEKQFGIPVFMNNDANCFALSEALDGAGQGHGVVFGVIMGTGVGGGVVFNGQLHQGHQHIGGEWGHNILEVNGPDCYCGQKGCIETLISGPGLAADFHRYSSDHSLFASDIVALAAQGEALAEASMQRFFDRFGRAMAMVVNILDPDVIVLGGGLSNVERLYSEGRERIAHYVFNDEFITPILKNIHGDSSGVRGAALLWSRHEV